ncbi:MAG: hypoxanthine phosphoribosyltransferase [Deltaproteobacteria bacterium]|nr:hypoxanthine phosphoribosyltransferase [Deltaproteobacteria bacterium]
MTQVHLKPLIPPEEVHLIVNRLASEIRRDYAGKNPLLVGILKGSFIFLADLIRALRIPLEVDFIRAASYGARTVTSGEVRITKDVDASIEARDVLLIEDIVDTGITIDAIMKILKARNPASLKFCALLYKPARKVVDVKIDYLGFDLGKEARFLVGYGLDYNEGYRYLPGIYIIEKEN